MDKFILLLIIVFILFAFLLFKINELQKKLSLETFNNSEYLTDVQAIRTLSVIAAGLQTNGYTVPGNLTIANELYTNGWFRTVGDGGLFFEKYKGGWHMTDNDWMRSYNNKNVYCNKEIRGETLQSDLDTNVRRNLQVDGQINCSSIKIGNIYIDTNGINFKGDSINSSISNQKGQMTFYRGEVDGLYNYTCFYMQKSGKMHLGPNPWRDIQI
jgi:hypothetical protein